MTAPTTTPIAPKVIDDANLPEGAHIWPVDKAMSSRIANMLNFDFAALGINGTYVMCPLLKCHGCGKISGLDDFVYGAMKVGVHNVAFMIKALVDEQSENLSPAHKLWCSGCDEIFLSFKINKSADSWLEYAKQTTFGPIGLINPTKEAAPVWVPGPNWRRYGEKEAAPVWVPGPNWRRYGAKEAAPVWVPGPNWRRYEAKEAAPVWVPGPNWRRYDAKAAAPVWVPGPNWRRYESTEASGI